MLIHGKEAVNALLDTPINTCVCCVRVLYAVGVIPRVPHHGVGCLVVSSKIKIYMLSQVVDAWQFRRAHMILNQELLLYVGAPVYCCKEEREEGARSGVCSACATRVVRALPREKLSRG